MVLSCVCLPLAMPADAAEHSLWQRADQQQHERIEQGADAYRKGDFAKAEKDFAGIDSADALYNQGNALAKQGRYDEAIAAYDRALRLRPKMEDAIENRKVVDAARKRKAAQNQQQQQQENSSGQGSPEEKKGKSQPGQQGKQQAQPDSPKQHQSPLPASQPESAQSPERKAADAKAQQAADAAQRERMAQAMARSGKGGQKDENSPGSTATVKETPAQREHRQAVEAWLRRVPDEPGNLLKTKFRLEYERRQKEGR